MKLGRLKRNRLDYAYAVRKDKSSCEISRLESSHTMYKEQAIEEMTKATDLSEILYLSIIYLAEALPNFHKYTVDLLEYIKLRSPIFLKSEP